MAKQSLESVSLTIFISWFVLNTGLISLPGDHEEYAPGTLCTVTGWGNTQENGQPSDILQKVKYLYMNFFSTKSKPYMPLVNLKKLMLFLRYLPEFRCSNIFAVTEHMRNQIILVSYQNKFFPKIFTSVLLDEFLGGFSNFLLFIVKICILIWYFWVIFENFSMCMLGIPVNDSIAHWVYKEMI